MSALKNLTSKIFRRANQKTGMTYDEMLERAYVELAIKKMADKIMKLRRIEIRSLELTKNIDSEVSEEMRMIISDLEA